MSVNTSTSLSNTVALYFERKFLERARAMLVHQEGAQFRGIEGNVGKTLIFNRYTPLALVTTPLTEGTNPSAVSIVDNQVQVVLQDYGNQVQVSRILSTTDIDDRDKEKIDLIAQNMGETLDALVRNACYQGATPQNAWNVTTGYFTPAAIQQAVATLQENKAPMYPGTFSWLGKLQPQTNADLMGSTVWQNAAVYSNVESLYQGEVGALYGVRFLVTNQGYTVSGTSGTVYSNFIHGREAFGVYDNQLDPPKLYIVTGPDSNNPAERFHTISWAGQFASTVLNSSWLIDVRAYSATS